MKSIYTLIILIGISITAYSQAHVNLFDLKSKKEYENIHVHKLHSETQSTSFVIWVKNGVKAHKHETHTETLYVIEGTGIMTLGSNMYKLKAGDFLTIPQNTVHSVTVTSKIPLKVLSIQAPEFLGKDRVFVDKNE